MVTDLFAVASGIPAAAFEWAIPPACRRGVDAPPPARRDGDDAVFEFPEWRPRRGARHFVPALSALSPRAVAFRFEIALRVAGAWSPWLATATVGAASFPGIGSAGSSLPAEVVSTEIDLWRTGAPADGIRLRLRVRAAPPHGGLEAPWLATLSACDLVPSERGAPPGAPVELPVPALSQFADSGPLGARLCSPTSLGMVLAYWDAPAPVSALAAETFHSDLDMYGVWPAAIAAAARRGVAGYLLRFPDWTAACWCLENGVPVIASVRYGEGELTGAAIARTEGHLLVLTGVCGDEVLVNDPAAADPRTVRRRYRREEMERVWLERAGVGYVLFKPRL